jgi:hypothetical protein
VIAPGLILTAAHVVLPEDGSVVEVHGLVEVRDLTGALAAAEVIWHDADLDAVLLRTDRVVGAGTSSVHWGELVCDYRARRTAGTMAGFPHGMSRAEDSQPLVNDLKVVDGHIKLVSGSRLGTYVFEVEDAVPDQVEEWQGLSGAGVFCEGVLVGVVLSVPPGWGNRILTVLPVNRLLSANSFVDVVGRHTDAVPRLQAADLRPLFKDAPPSQLSSSFPLHPRSRVVPLSGMDRLLDPMRAWCDNAEHPVGVALVTGRGGTGKNRLVPELLDRLAPPWSGPNAHRRWHGGFLSRRPHRAEYEMLTAANHPLLIAVDQAETRLGRVEELLDTLAERPGVSSIRVLLIARDMDTWWPTLHRRYGAGHGMPVATFTVDAFDALEAGAEDAYVNGKVAFAQRIRHLREAGHGDHTWKNAAIADAPRAHGEGVEHSRPTPVIPVRAGERHLGDPCDAHRLRGQQEHLGPPPGHHRSGAAADDPQQSSSLVVVDLSYPHVFRHGHSLAANAPSEVQPGRRVTSRQGKRCLIRH